MKKIWLFVFTCVFVLGCANPCFAGDAEALQKGLSLVRAGKNSEAVPLLTAVGQNAAAPSNERSMAYYILSVADEANAIAYLTQAIELDPSFDRPHLRKAELLFDAKEYAAVIATVDAAEPLFPNIERLYTLSGMSQQALGNLPEAIADFSRSVQYRGTNMAVYVLRGRAYQLAGQNEKALADLRVAARATKGFTNKELFNLYYHQGLALKALGRQAQADAAFKKALAVPGEGVR